MRVIAFVVALFLVGPAALVIEDWLTSKPRRADNTSISTGSPESPGSPAVA